MKMTNLKTTFTLQVLKNGEWRDLTSVNFNDRDEEQARKEIETQRQRWEMNYYRKMNETVQMRIV